MIIGIDPGVDGAIAVLDDGLTYYSLWDMPTMALSKNKRQVNGAELAEMLRRLCEEWIITAYVERVGSMPHQGVASMFNFGVSYGVVLGVLASFSIPMVLITPGVWKKRAGLTGKPKDMARTLAQQLYPLAELGRKRDIGRADALLIARFGGIVEALKEVSLSDVQNITE